MSSVIYSRYFSTATAVTDDIVTVFVDITLNNFPPGLWVDNFGDNLGGSGPNGPLDFIPGSNLDSFSGLVINGTDRAFGVAGGIGHVGCIRFWCNTNPGGAGYPSSTGIPVSWSTTLGNSGILHCQADFVVTKQALVGTKIGPPTILAIPNASNINADTLMFDVLKPEPVDFQFLIDTEHVNNTLMIMAPPCFANDSWVKVFRHENLDLCSVPISKLGRGSLLSSSTGEKVPLLYVVNFEKPVAQFIRIQAGALGEGCPLKTLNICRGHPLLFGGQVINPEDLLDWAGVDNICAQDASDEKMISTLVTKERVFVEVQGLYVATWSLSAWENATKNEERFKRITWTKQM